MKLVFFEDSDYRRLGPLTSVFPSFMLEVGSKRIYEYWSDFTGISEVALFVRRRVAGLCKWLLNVVEGREVEVNPSELGNDVLALNHALLPVRESVELAKKILGWPGNVLVYGGEKVLMVKASASFAESLADILVQEPSAELFLNLAEYTRDIPFPNPPILRRPADLLSVLAEVLSGEGRISGEVEENVIIDTKRGGVIVEEEAVIEGFSRLVGPLYIGKGVVVKAGSRLERVSLSGNSIVSGTFNSCIMGRYVKADGVRLKNTVSPGYVTMAPFVSTFYGYSVLGYCSSYYPLTALEGDCEIGRGSEVKGRFTGKLGPFKRYIDGLVEDVAEEDAAKRLREILGVFGRLPSDYELLPLRK